MKDVMVDIESMGNTATAAIAHIAAVQFDRNTGEVGMKFDMSVKLQSSFDAGLTPQGSTILWWLQQDESARKALVQKQGTAVSLSEAVGEFNAYLSEFGPDVVLWGNSARFDLGIISQAMEMLHVAPNWKFWNEMCVRTVSALAPDVKRGTKFAGTAHNALDDCQHQILYTVNTLRKLQGKPAVALSVKPLPVEEEDELPF